MSVHAVEFHKSPSAVSLRIVDIPRSSQAIARAQAPPRPTPEEAPPEPEIDHRPIIAKLLKTLSQSCDQALLDQQAVLERMQDAIVELAITTASHVVQKEIDAGNLSLVEIVRSAIEELLPATRITVRVHPEDAHALSEVLKEDEQTLDGRIDMLTDSRLQRGSCRVENENHGLLSTPQIRLENAKESLNQAFDHGQLGQAHVGEID